MSCRERMVKFSADWHLGVRIKTLIFGDILSSCLKKCPLFPRHWLVWARHHFRLGERVQPDHEWRCDLGRDNGRHTIPPHDHFHALGGSYRPHFWPRVLWWSPPADLSLPSCSVEHARLHASCLAGRPSQTVQSHDEKQSSVLNVQNVWGSGRVLPTSPSW